jgi:hypothetical protein
MSTASASFRHHRANQVVGDDVVRILWGTGQPLSFGAGGLHSDQRYLENHRWWWGLLFRALPLQQRWYLFDSHFGLLRQQDFRRLQILRLWILLLYVDPWDCFGEGLQGRMAGCRSTPKCSLVDCEMFSDCDFWILL